MLEQTDHPYSDDDLRAALQYIGEKTSNRPCPMCGAKSWTFESAGSVLAAVPKVAYVPMTMVAHFGRAPAIPVITLTCENCGFIRHHNIPMVMTKAGENG
jgi:rubredoxin